MSISINFLLPTWLCYFVVIVIYIAIFTALAALCAYIVFNLFRTYIARCGLTRRWFFWSKTRIDPNYCRTFLQPAMNEWMRENRKNYYSAVWSSLEDNGIDFLAWAKNRYGQGYEEAMKTAEAGHE